MNQGFDGAADRYDSDEAGNPVLSYMRSRALRRLRAAFRRGSRLLEMGSGTGTEAALLASEGHALALLDVSPRLLEVASAKVKAASPRALLGAHRLPAREVAHLVDIYGAGGLDGAYSSFGPLNCEPDLRPVARGLAELLPRGARVVLSIINRWYPAEALWFLGHGELGDAVRRVRGHTIARAFPGGPMDVATWYYSARDAAKAFAPEFEVSKLEALPLLWPPPYLDGGVRRFPKVFGALRIADEVMAGWPVFRGLGDHFLMVLVRR